MEHSGYSLRDWLNEHPPPDDAFTQTAAGVAERVLRGDAFLPAVRELLDEVELMPRDELRERAIGQEPARTGDARWDAYLAALAEHVAARWSLPRPQWTIEASRFLDRFWFVSDVPGLRANAIVHSPAAFRRRGIFLGEGALARC